MITIEIRGRGMAWKVLYPNEERLASPIAVFDREGIFKETVFAGADTTGMTEAHFVGSQEEAIAYANYLSPGCEVKVSRTNTQAEALEKARKATAKKREQSDDD